MEPLPDKRFTLLQANEIPDLGDSKILCRRVRGHTSWEEETKKCSDPRLKKRFGDAGVRVPTVPELHAGLQQQGAYKKNSWSPAVGVPGKKGREFVQLGNKVENDDGRFEEPELDPGAFAQVGNDSYGGVCELLRFLGSLYYVHLVDTNGGHMLNKCAGGRGGVRRTLTWSSCSWCNVTTGERVLPA